MGDVSREVFEKQVYSDKDFEKIYEVTAYRATVAKSANNESLDTDDANGKEIIASILVSDEIDLHSHMKDKISKTVNRFNIECEKDTGVHAADLCMCGPTKGKERTLFKFKEYQAEDDEFVFPLWELKDVSRFSYIFNCCDDLLIFYK
jgi:hypothetical protein